MLKSFSHNETTGLDPLSPIPPHLRERFNAPALSGPAIERWIADAGYSGECEVEAVALTGSTNEDLLQRARAAQPHHPWLLAADAQFAGRGRLRRAWIARPRSALLFSVALPLDPLPPALPAVTLACGAGVAEFLATRGIKVALKWPNDLRIDGCKLGGMLAEIAVDFEGRAALVIGIGINVWLNEEDRLAIDQPTIALADLLPRAQLVAEREAWIGALACVLLKTAERFIAEGFVAFRARFNALLEGRGEVVEVLDDGRHVAKGRVVEVDTIGRLVLQTDSGMRAISVGDVSIRKENG